MQDGNKNDSGISTCLLVTHFYEEFELAVQTGNCNDASLLESQADKVYELAENLEIIIREQGG
ncbi:MAG: hypothetical protein KME60_25390 [Cyanomargarita calcarea GSE-NOS-MK-12-04C]|uniref:Uncharacterized protein n=1 Tax=Cyanomargarita calcarea GSE-NOS-MK-12-04C TaxID=2839659 RepID=A0A951UUG4_9CYAN|nr:hypothetical protein [Cyanomargarita calcarea GSE-NOS-MK-12-04C]